MYVLLTYSMETISGLHNVKKYEMTGSLAGSIGTWNLLWRIWFQCSSVSASACYLWYITDVAWAAGIFQHQEAERKYIVQIMRNRAQIVVRLKGLMLWEFFVKILLLLINIYYSFTSGLLIDRWICPPTGTLQFFITISVWILPASRTSEILFSCHFDIDWR